MYARRDHQRNRSCGLGFILGLLGAVTVITACDVEVAAADPLLGRVHTEFGTCLRVTARRATEVFQSPGGTAKVVRLATPFESFYVLGTERQTLAAGTYARDGYYRVAGGPSTDHEVGWIRESDVVVWPHRLLVGRSANALDSPVEVYATKDGLIAGYRGNAAVRNKPRARDSGERTRHLLPLLNRWQFETQAETLEAYDVSSVYPPGWLSDEEQPQQPVQPLVLAPYDFVFVVDTTRGNQPLIEAVRDAVRGLALERTDASAESRVRLGLVGFRDALAKPSPDWYVARWFCALDQGSDARQFAAAVAKMAAAEEDDANTAEGILEALKLAMEDARWADSAYKHVFVLGDATAKTGRSAPGKMGHLTIDSILALAQPRGGSSFKKVTIHALLRGTDSSALEHFRNLAAGEEFPGLIRTFDGARSVESMVRDVLSGLQKRPESAISGGEERPPPVPVLLEFAAAHGPEAGKLDRLAEGAVCQVAPDGRILLEPYVLVDYQQLVMFDAFLEVSLKGLRAGSRSKKDLRDALELLQGYSVSIVIGEAYDSSRPFADFQRLMGGLPVQSSVMTMTIEKLVSMSNADFDKWIEGIGKRRTAIRKLLQDQRVWRTVPTGGASRQLRISFVRLADLP